MVSLRRASRVGLLLLLGSTIPGLAQKPDFKLFSIHPKYLVNHTTTTVHWVGTHFAGVQLTDRGVCKMLSYTSTDTEIVMKIQAERPLTDKLGYCNLYLHNRFGSNDSWVMVNFTSEDEKQIKSADLARNVREIKREMSRAGSQWTLHYANGSTSVLQAEPPNQFGTVPFHDDHGAKITIIVMDDGQTLLEFPNDCRRLGTLHNGRVANGRSFGNCSPAGAWTAEMK